MLIPKPTLPAGQGIGAAAPAGGDGDHTRPRFATVLEQLPTPPFAPWPAAVESVKTPVAALPSQTTQPAERGRRQGQRRGRG